LNRRVISLQTSSQCERNHQGAEKQSHYTHISPTLR
jgi:hypothetical protein